MLTLQRIRGVLKCGREACRGNVRIVLEDIGLGRAARKQFEDELHADARAADTGLSAKDADVGDDPLSPVLVRH